MRRGRCGCGTHSGDAISLPVPALTKVRCGILKPMSRFSLRSQLPAHTPAPERYVKVAVGTSGRFC